MKDKTLILADIDGTLTNKSLVLSHAMFLIEHGVIKDTGSGKAWQSDMKNEQNISSLAMDYRKAITGKAEKELMISDFFREFFKESKNWYSHFNVDFVQEFAKNPNFEIVLVSGSCDFLVSPLAKELGARFFATKYLMKKNVFSGEIKGMFNHSQKSKVIKSLNTEKYKTVVAFGDTMSDVALFEKADISFLVSPARETLKNILPLGLPNMNVIDYE